MLHLTSGGSRLSPDCQRGSHRTSEAGPFPPGPAWPWRQRGEPERARAQAVGEAEAGALGWAQRWGSGAVASGGVPAPRA